MSVCKAVCECVYMKDVSWIIEEVDSLDDLVILCL